MPRSLLAVLTATAALAAALAPAAAHAAPKQLAGGDHVVVAVIDSGVNPYHHDFKAINGQQRRVVDPRSFSSFGNLNLTLAPDDPKAAAAKLAEKDAKTLETVKPSAPGEVHGYAIPGTKVVAAVTFDDQGELFKGVGAHGAGVASSAVGGLHGTCPECLLVFIDKGETPADGEAAIDWAMSQEWIDVITNSYGFSAVQRDRVYSGSNTDLQRRASERGQTIFFSSGNGQENAFTVPNTTTFSSQEGPDWIVTVGAIAPGADNFYGNRGNHGQYLGAGKPADVAGIGSDYPTAYGAATVGGTGTTGFSGTSNATPQVAGLYARALYVARQRLGGPSRFQGDGVVARGDRVHCAGCPLGDGTLTAAELRTRLFHGAIPTGAGTTTFVGGQVPKAGEEELLSQGHGAYFGRESKDRGAWLKEFDRIVAPMEGRAAPLQRPAGEREWMIVDSYCRQQMWGDWSGGYFRAGATPLPGPSPAWPVRSAYERTCPGGPVG